jgi:hypothetical protein
MINSGESEVNTGVRADFWFGLGLAVLGIAVVFESWRMPRLADLNVHPMTVPGLVPGMIGIVIAVLGSILFARAARAGGFGGFSVLRKTSWNISALADPASQTRRFFITLALCFAYAGGLVGSLPFWAATGTFIFLFVLIFEWQVDRPLSGHVRAIVTALLLAVIVSAAVTYVFEQVFLVRVP